MSLFTEQCVVVRPGDRLGVYSEHPQSSVAYMFDALNPRAVAHTFDNHSHPLDREQTVNFDTLVFPYAFSAAAYYYVIGIIIDLRA